MNPLRSVGALAVATAIFVATAILVGCSGAVVGRPTAQATATVDAGVGSAPIANASGAATRKEPGGPGASLVSSGGGPIAGALGSWAFDSSGTDVPWIPARALTAIELAARTTPKIAFADGALIGRWQAVIAPVADATGQSAVAIAGREAPSPALSSVAVGPLPSGEWVVSVRLFRADGRGDATFFWLLRVD